MRIVFYPADNEGCGNYRCILPAQVISFIGDDEVQISNRATDELMEWGDIFIWQRRGKPGQIEWLKKYPDKVHVYENDDDLPNMDSSNPSYGEFKDPEIVKSFSEFVGLCDHVTCPTETLKKELAKHNKNVTVLPNSMPLGSIKYARRTNSDNIRIGWMGSPYHVNDIPIVQDVLAALVDKYKNVKIVWAGYFPDSLKKSIPKDRIEVQDWMSFEDYYDSISKLNIDIGLAPLDFTKYNKSRSNLKFLEYSFIGACTVASNIDPYSTTIENGIDGVIVKTNKYKHWYNALASLIESPEEVDRMKVNAHNKLVDKYDLQQNIQNNIELYRSLINNKG